MVNLQEIEQEIVHVEKKNDELKKLRTHILKLCQQKGDTADFKKSTAMYKATYNELTKRYEVFKSKLEANWREFKGLSIEECKKKIGTSEGKDGATINYAALDKSGVCHTYGDYYPSSDRLSALQRLYYNIPRVPQCNVRIQPIDEVDGKEEKDELTCGDCKGCKKDGKCVWKYGQKSCPEEWLNCLKEDLEDSNESEGNQSEENEAEELVSEIEPAVEKCWRSKRNGDADTAEWEEVYGLNRSECKKLRRESTVKWTKNSDDAFQWEEDESTDESTDEPTYPGVVDERLRSYESLPQYDPTGTGGGSDVPAFDFMQFIGDYGTAIGVAFAAIVIISGMAAYSRRAVQQKL